MKKLFATLAVVWLFLVIWQSGSWETPSHASQVEEAAFPRSGIGMGGVLGLWVDQVLPNSPAAIAGIKRGDVVTQIDDISIDHALRFRQMIGDAAPGSTFTLSIRRYNQMTASWEPKRVKVTSVPFDQVPPPSSRP
jgi:S1-C subfamily serine protease